MKGFTYHDYLYYKKFFINNQIITVLREDDESYIYEEKEQHQMHDKIFKEVLDNKKEAVKFLNEMLKLKNTKYKLEEKKIEKYNRKFITNDFSNMESDVIYKKIDQNIFFLIEHQSTVDYSMPYRILKYNMAIMESAIDKEKVKNKNYKLPTIYSFVIYTGKKKWNATNYLVNKQERLEGYRIENFANFQIVDINDYTKKKLLDSESLLAKMMLLEKAKNFEELEIFLQAIIEKTIDNSQIIFLERLIKYVFKNKLDSEKLRKYMQELESKQEKGGDSMFVDIMVKKFEEMVEMEEKIKKKESKIQEKESKIQEKESKIQEKESKIQEKESKIKEQESKIKKKESKMEERESKIKEEEVKIEQEKMEIKERQEAVNTAEKQIIIKMLENNIDESTILKMLEIDKNKLEKIKRDNNFKVANDLS